MAPRGHGILMESPNSKFPKEVSLGMISPEDRLGTTSLEPIHMTWADKPLASALYSKKATGHVGQTSESVGYIGILIIISM